MNFQSCNNFKISVNHQPWGVLHVNVLLYFHNLLALNFIKHQFSFSDNSYTNIQRIFYFIKKKSYEGVFQ